MMAAVTAKSEQDLQCHIWQISPAEMLDDRFVSVGGRESYTVLWLVGFRSYSEFRNTQKAFAETQPFQLQLKKTTVEREFKWKQLQYRTWAFQRDMSH